MINYNNKNWFGFLLHTKGSMIEMVLPPLFVMGLFTALICFLQFVLEIINIKINLQVHSLVGLVLGLLLVFRTNTAYERWWEGRKELGGLVNTTRNLAMHFDAIIPKDDLKSRELLSNLIISYVFALKEHLREGVKMEELYLDSDQASSIVHVQHKPIAILQMINNQIQSLKQEGKMTNEEHLLLSNLSVELINIIGKCERIKKTPIPIAYAYLLKRIVFAYVITLPFGVVHDLEWFAIPAVMLIFYIMVSIEVIAEEIEDPFGVDYNDLPVDTISANIKSNIQEILTNIHNPESKTSGNFAIEM